ncbi:MAG: GNAT family N-acetyltransferase [Rubrivivax sp.]
MTPPPAFVDGARASLRRVSLQDGAALFLAADDAEVMRYMDWPRPRGADEVAAYLEGAVARWDEGLEFVWAMVDRSTQAVVGTVSCRPQAHAADFGFLLARAHWGRGLAAEAAVWVTTWLAQQPGIFRVWATADAENRRSRQLLERLGLTFEGILRQATVRPNIGAAPRDTALYARTRGAGWTVHDG